MLFSELISKEQYKPNPNKRAKDDDKVRTRLTLAAYQAFEDAVAEGKIDLLEDRHYVQVSELVDAAGGKFTGRDRRVEDFNLDETDKTNRFLREFFSSKRGYGPRKTKETQQGKWNEEREALRLALVEASEASKAKKVSVSELQGTLKSLLKAYKDYGSKVIAMRGTLPD